MTQQFSNHVSVRQSPVTVGPGATNPGSHALRRRAADSRHPLRPSCIAALPVVRRGMRCAEEMDSVGEQAPNRVVRDSSN